MSYSEEWVTARARAGYEHGRASFAIRSESTALLVIDMQDEFVRPGWSPYWVPAATRMASRLCRFVDDCRAAGIPVIWTLFDDTHLGLDRPRALRYVPRADTNWHRPGPAAVWDQMDRRADEILIRKPSYGAFYTPHSTRSCATWLGTRSSSREHSPTTAAARPHGRPMSAGTRWCSAQTSRPPTTNPGKNRNWLCCAAGSRSCSRQMRSPPG